MKNLESNAQIKFCQYLHRNHPDIWFFAIPNGGHRDKRIGARLKAEGVKRGVPDLYLPSLRLWVEMKIQGGRLSEDQKRWHEYLKQHGDTVLTCYGAEQAIEMFEDFIKNRGEEKEQSPF